MNYAEHIIQLTKAFGVRVDVDPGLEPECATAGPAMIHIPPVTDDTSYAVALHELGHCLHPLGRLTDQMSATCRRTHACATARDLALQLEEEYAAWSWAKHYALEWTTGMAHTRRLALTSYKIRAKKILGRPI